jgi:death-on-curing protein
LNKPIRFLAVAEVKRIHETGLHLFSGRSGTDEALLSSAVAQPQWDHKFGEMSLRRLSASYAFHLTSDHPFIEGNKRAATGAALVFLKLNGEVPLLDHKDLEALIWQVSAGDFTKEDFIRLFLELFPRDLFLK